MDAEFSDDSTLPRERLRELSVRNNRLSARRFAAQLLGYLGTAIGLILLDNPLVLGVLLIGNAMIQFGMFGMLHESCHNTVFTSRGLNRMAGWFAALAQPMSPALMRAFHFEHHRHTHQLERDPELAGLAFMAAWPRGVLWLASMSGISVLIARVGWATFAALVPRTLDSWTKVLPFVRPEERQRIAWEARILLAVHAGLITVAAIWLPTLGRVYVGLLLGHMLLSWYITCEHRGLPENGTIFDRTRTLLAPAWIRWLVWNMPYHAEHHAWPAVPWHALPRVHELVRNQLVHVERPLYLHMHGGRERSQRELGSAESD